MNLKTILISSGSSGMRLGNYLRFLFPDMRESDLRRLFSGRDVKLDGHPASADALLREGQELKIYLPDREPPVLRVVYEDDDVLLVNKPSGVSVESDGTGGLSLTEICRIYREEHGFSGTPSPCHRLDVKTCGLCLFAKNDRALDILREAFRIRSVDKYYICLVRGMMKPPAAVCNAYLLKDSEHGKVSVTDHPVPGAKPISTGYETIENGPVSRLKVHLITGRTHQIRAHLSAMGHPILGDDVYGDRAFNRAHKARVLKLCAVSLTVRTNGQLPNLDGKTFSIDAPF